MNKANEIFDHGRREEVNKKINRTIAIYSRTICDFAL